MPTELPTSGQTTDMGIYKSTIRLLLSTSFTTATLLLLSKSRIELIVYTPWDIIIVDVIVVDVADVSAAAVDNTGLTAAMIHANIASLIF